MLIILFYDTIWYEFLNKQTMLNNYTTNYTTECKQQSWLGDLCRYSPYKYSNLTLFYPSKRCSKRSAKLSMNTSTVLDVSPRTSSSAFWAWAGWGTASPRILATGSSKVSHRPHLRESQERLSACWCIAFHNTCTMVYKTVHSFYSYTCR